MSAIEDIQHNYIEELRRIKPDIDAWWFKVLTLEEEQTVWNRWPTGPSGHPRVLDVFRKYFLEIDILNRRAENVFVEGEKKDGDALWGEHDLGDAPAFERQLDWLILDIGAKAPDLETLVRGICFVPIGLDESSEYV